MNGDDHGSKHRPLHIVSVDKFSILVYMLLFENENIASQPYHAVLANTLRCVFANTHSHPLSLAHVFEAQKPFLALSLSMSFYFPWLRFFAFWPFPID